MNIPLFKNTACTVLLVFIASAFFIVLGMAVGYVFSTQEGAIMASIVLGSIFLFLSNLVVPLESLAPALSHIIKFNPYVLASELLRKSLLFNVNIITEAAFTLALLGGAALLIFLLILLSTALANRKRVRTSTQAVIIVDGVDSAGEMSEQEAQKQLVHEFKAGEKTAASKEELFKLLSDMPKSEFEDNVTPYENKIADWVEHELKDKRLASKLRKTSSRKDMLRTLGGEVKAAENKEEKEEGNEEEEQQK
jgi:hypothetical protein